MLLIPSTYSQSLGISNLQEDQAKKRKQRQAITAAKRKRVTEGWTEIDFTKQRFVLMNLNTRENFAHI